MTRSPDGLPPACPGWTSTTPDGVIQDPRKCWAVRAGSGPYTSTCNSPTLDDGLFLCDNHRAAICGPQQERAT